jgi:hypothetical protein
VPASGGTVFGNEYFPDLSASRKSIRVRTANEEIELCLILQFSEFTFS